MSRVLSTREIWSAPVVLGVLSLVGLVAALVTDGWGDILSALALSVPAAASLWGFRRQRASSAPEPSRHERRAVRPVRPPH